MVHRVVGRHLRQVGWRGLGHRAPPLGMISADLGPGGGLILPGVGQFLPEQVVLRAMPLPGGWLLSGYTPTHAATIGCNQSGGFPRAELMPYHTLKPPELLS